MRFVKIMATALAVSVGVLSFAGSADAGDRGWRPDRDGRHWRHHGGWHGGHGYRYNNGDALAAGIIGFGAGAILGGALAQPRYYAYEPAPVYVAPAPVYVEPAPVYSYSAGAAPWSAEWYAYCDARYRSFNSRTGYFLGYDGEYHFCR
jgi:hypothetical protein